MDTPNQHRPTGRPKTKRYQTLMARVPEDLAHAAQAYAQAHNLTLSDLIRQGLVIQLSDTSPQTVRQESLPVRHIVRHYVLQEVIERLDALESQVRHILERSRSAPARRETPQGMSFDPERWVLGRLCPRGHEYEHTGQTLRRLRGFRCPQCENELAQERREARHRETS